MVNCAFNYEVLIATPSARTRASKSVSSNAAIGNRSSNPPNLMNISREIAKLHEINAFPLGIMGSLPEQRPGVFAPVSGSHKRNCCTREGTLTR